MTSELTGLADLVIDGTNLLHRVAGSPDRASLRLILPGLRAAMPPGTRALIILDGTSDHGAPFRERIGSSIEIRYAGRVDADTAIVAIIGAQGWAQRGDTIVVTDDRALTERVRTLGARTRRLDWFASLVRLPGYSGATTGQRRSRRGRTC